MALGVIDRGTRFLRGVSSKVRLREIEERLFADLDDLVIELSRDLPDARARGDEGEAPAARRAVASEGRDQFGQVLLGADRIAAGERRIAMDFVCDEAFDVRRLKVAPAIV